MVVEYIEITFVDLSSQLSKEWKLLSEAEKMVSFKPCVQS